MATVELQKPISALTATADYQLPTAISVIKI